jgi:hypothetical protein
VATDHVIESFRNALAGLQDGRGHRPLLYAQFQPLELAALGVVVWPMVEFEADDALAAAAVMAAADSESTRSSSALLTRIWRSACEATGSCSSIGAGGAPQRAGVQQKFGVLSPSIRTGSRSWA